QAVMTPPWPSAATMPSMIGNAARNGQENGSTATPNASVAAGDSSTQASRVSAAQDTNARVAPGRGTAAGPGQPEQCHVEGRAGDQDRHDQGAEPQPGLGVSEQPAQVVVGGERRERGDLGGDGTRVRGEEREQPTLDHGAACRGED